MGAAEPYIPPNWMQSHVGNRMASFFGRRFVGQLTVRGRHSGEPRTVPVAVLEHEGDRYLIAPRGRTHWVRNLRAAGEGRAEDSAAARGASGPRRSRLPSAHR